MNVVSTALLYEIIVAERLDMARVVVASSQSAMGEGLYHCPVHGEQLPGMRLETALAAGQWDIPCPVCGGPLEMQHHAGTGVQPSERLRDVQARRGDGGGQPGPALRHPHRRPCATASSRARASPSTTPTPVPAASSACTTCRARRPTLYEDGGNIRDYVNIDDVVDANVLVLDDEAAAGQVFNVGGGKPVTTREFAEVARRQYGSDLPGQVTGEYRFGDTRHILSDISALRRLGWEPQRTPADSVAAYAAWLEGMDGLDGVLAEANARMRALGVVREGEAPMKAFLLAAGLGTRLRPLTDHTPKCMLAIDGRPMLDIWLDAFDRAGVDEVLVNLH